MSVGILRYPLTVLVTDILSEVYGKRRANQVVLVGFLASMMVSGIVHLALAFPARSAGATDAASKAVFGRTWRLITGSMVAYLLAQLVDVQMFRRHIVPDTGEECTARMPRRPLVGTAVGVFQSPEASKGFETGERRGVYVSSTEAGSRARWGRALGVAPGRCSG